MDPISNGITVKHEEKSYEEMCFDTLSDLSNQMDILSDQEESDYALEVDPISYKLPEDPNDNQSGTKKKRTPTVPLDFEPMTGTGPEEWWDYWLVQPRRRQDGRLDKYYFRKDKNIACRSILEIVDYEVHGVLPGAARRQWKKDQKLQGEENEELENSVERFCKESHQNLLALFRPRAPQQLQGEEEEGGEKGKEKVAEHHSVNNDSMLIEVPVNYDFYKF